MISVYSTTNNQKADIIRRLCEMLIDDELNEGVDLVNKNYPFVEIEKLHSRKYTKAEMMRIYLRDGFIDRYSGERLLFPGLIRLLTLEMPSVFKYHKNWKMSETHMIYCDLFPTIDHIVPIARGGSNSEENWITTSQLRNSAKSNFTVEELGWEILPPGSLESWDGLCSVFTHWIANGDLVKKHSHTKDWRYIMGWYDALTQVQNKAKVNLVMSKDSEGKKKTAKQNQGKKSVDATLINIRKLNKGDLYRTNSKSKAIYLVLSSYDLTSNCIATAIINNHEANPANVIYLIRSEKQNNVNVLQIVDYPQSPEEIIASLPSRQQHRVRQLYKTTI